MSNAKRVRIFGSDCVNVFLRCRLVPSFCFLYVIEFDESKLFKRKPIKPSYVTGTDEIVTACGFGSGFSLFGKGFVNLGDRLFSGIAVTTKNGDLVLSVGGWFGRCSLRAD